MKIEIIVERLIESNEWLNVKLEKYIQSEDYEKCTKVISRRKENNKRLKMLKRIYNAGGVYIKMVESLYNLNYIEYKEIGQKIKKDKYNRSTKVD